jgi:membrane protein required for colicin V production
MEELNFFAVDIFIATVILLSLIFGWARGATKEILSVISWIGGIYFTISTFPRLKDITREYISNRLIADFVTSCALFILFLTILSILNYFFSNIVKKSVLNTVDKALGGIFGIIRGVIILGILDIVINQCLFSEIPKCVEESRLRPSISSVSNFIILVLPEPIQEKILSHMTQLKKESLLNFVKNNVINHIDEDSSGNDIFKTMDDKVLAKNSDLDNDLEEFLNDSKDASDKSQSAEDLATLKPKKIIDADNVPLDENTQKKGRKDMNRLLDGYDDIDEN